MAVELDDSERIQAADIEQRLLESLPTDRPDDLLSRQFLMDVNRGREDHHLIPLTFTGPHQLWIEMRVVVAEEVHWRLVPVEVR
jgi:hypothetical protein